MHLIVRALPVALILVVLLFVLITPAWARGEVGGPTLLVQNCSSVAPFTAPWLSSGTFQVPFTLTDCSGPAEQQTFVELCHDEDYLRYRFVSYDNNVFSSFTECNDPLYEQDVVEVFVAPALPEGQAMHNYLELELSPNGVLFSANVTNPNLTCLGIEDAMLDCSLFEYSAGIVQGTELWWGEIGVPFSVLNQFEADPSSSGVLYRSNMFRVDRPLGEDIEYSCWSCDHSIPDTPCFHRPTAFGYLSLV